MDRKRAGCSLTERDPHKMAMIAYKYALRNPEPLSDTTPLGWGNDCENQLKLQHEFWNDMVVIDQKYIQLKRNTINEPQILIDLNERIKTFQERLETLIEGLKQLNKTTKRRVKVPEIDDEIKYIKGQLKTLYEQAKEARKLSIEENKPILVRLNEDRYAELANARRAIAEKGLWWGNYNATWSSFNVAVSRVYKEGGELQIKTNFNGEGRLTNQIQSGGIHVNKLIAGRHSQVKFVDEPWNYKGKGQKVRQARQQYHMDFCAYTDPVTKEKRMVRFPLVYHRPLPDGIVKQVVVKRIREFDRWKWFVVFTLEVPDQSRVPGHGIATVNLGWRKTDEGIRIATVLREGRIDYVLYPHYLYHAQLKMEKRRGEMDDTTNKQKDWLSNLPIEDAPGNIQHIVKTMLQMERVRGGHFEWLRRSWYDAESNSWEPGYLEELEVYCDVWRLYSRTAAARRQWVADARQYYYRAEVRRLFAGVDTIVMNAHDMSKTAKKSPTSLPREVQHTRFLTAPSIFREALNEYIRKVKINVLHDEQPHDVCACHGAPFVNINRQNLMWNCSISGHEIDQDNNFVRILLQRYSPIEDDKEEASMVT